MIFASMLLVLAIVYPFLDFKIHAASLTSILAESGGNTIVLSALICHAYWRSIWDIPWSLATMSCSWVSILPNISSPNWWRVFLRRIEFMFWAVVGLELAIALVLRQWSSAHCLVGRVN